eukprot:g8872.t1
MEKTEAEEKTLHEQLKPHLRNLYKGKRLALFRELLRIAVESDPETASKKEMIMAMCDKLVEGFSMDGELPPTGFWKSVPKEKMEQMRAEMQATNTERSRTPPDRSDIQADVEREKVLRSYLEENDRILTESAKTAAMEPEADPDSETEFAFAPVSQKRDMRDELGSSSAKRRKVEKPEWVLTFSDCSVFGARTSIHECCGVSECLMLILNKAINILCTLYIDDVHCLSRRDLSVFDGAVLDFVMSAMGFWFSEGKTERQDYFLQKVLVVLGMAYTLHSHIWLTIEVEAKKLKQLLEQGIALILSIEQKRCIESNLLSYKGLYRHCTQLDRTKSYLARALDFWCGENFRRSIVLNKERRQLLMSVQTMQRAATKVKPFSMSPATVNAPIAHVYTDAAADDLPALSDLLKKGVRKGLERFNLKIGGFLQLPSGVTKSFSMHIKELPGEVDSMSIGALEAAAARMAVDKFKDDLKGHFTILHVDNMGDVYCLSRNASRSFLIQSICSQFHKILMDFDLQVYVTWIYAQKDTFLSRAAEELIGEVSAAEPLVAASVTEGHQRASAGLSALDLVQNQADRNEAALWLLAEVDFDTAPLAARLNLVREVVRIATDGSFLLHDNKNGLFAIATDLVRRLLLAPEMRLEKAELADFALLLVRARKVVPAAVFPLIAEVEEREFREKRRNRIREIPLAGMQMLDVLKVLYGGAATGRENGNTVVGDGGGVVDTSVSLAWRWLELVATKAVQSEDFLATLSIADLASAATLLSKCGKKKLGGTMLETSMNLFEKTILKGRVDSDLLTLEGTGTSSTIVDEVPTELWAALSCVHPKQTRSTFAALYPLLPLGTTAECRDDTEAHVLIMGLLRHRAHMLHSTITTTAGAGTKTGEKVEARNFEQDYHLQRRLAELLDFSDHKRDSLTTAGATTQVVPTTSSTLSLNNSDFAALWRYVARLDWSRRFLLDSLLAATERRLPSFQQKDVRDVMTGPAGIGSSCAIRQSFFPEQHTHPASARSATTSTRQRSLFHSLSLGGQFEVLRYLAASNFFPPVETKLAWARAAHAYRRWLAFTPFKAGRRNREQTRRMLVAAGSAAAGPAGVVGELRDVRGNRAVLELFLRSVCNPGLLSGRPNTSSDHDGATDINVNWLAMWLTRDSGLEIAPMLRDLVLPEWRRYEEERHADVRKKLGDVFEEVNQVESSVAGWGASGAVGDSSAHVVEELTLTNKQVDRSDVVGKILDDCFFLYQWKSTRYADGAVPLPTRVKAAGGVVRRARELQSEEHEEEDYLQEVFDVGRGQHNTASAGTRRRLQLLRSAVPETHHDRPQQHDHEDETVHLNYTVGDEAGAQLRARPKRLLLSPKAALQEKGEIMAAAAGRDFREGDDITGGTDDAGDCNEDGGFSVSPNIETRQDAFVKRGASIFPSAAGMRRKLLLRTDKDLAAVGGSPVRQFSTSSSSTYADGDETSSCSGNPNSFVVDERDFSTLEKVEFDVTPQQPSHDESPLSRASQASRGSGAGSADSSDAAVSARDSPTRKVKTNTGATEVTLADIRDAIEECGGYRATVRAAEAAIGRKFNLWGPGRIRQITRKRLEYFIRDEFPPVVPTSRDALKMRRVVEEFLAKETHRTGERQSEVPNLRTNAKFAQFLERNGFNFWVAEAVLKSQSAAYFTGNIKVVTLGGKEKSVDGTVVDGDRHDDIFASREEENNPEAFEKRQGQVRNLIRALASTRFTAGTPYREFHIQRALKTQLGLKNWRETKKYLGKKLDAFLVYDCDAPAGISPIFTPGGAGGRGAAEGAAESREMAQRRKERAREIELGKMRRQLTAEFRQQAVKEREAQAEKLRERVAKLQERLSGALVPGGGGTSATSCAHIVRKQ